jgi:hypothetical protein
VVRVTSSAEGLLRARLKSRGDWDLGVFDAKTKRYVAGSAGPRGNELAEGFSGPVQVVDVSHRPATTSVACRRSAST